MAAWQPSSTLSIRALPSPVAALTGDPVSYAPPRLPDRPAARISSSCSYAGTGAFPDTASFLDRRQPSGCTPRLRIGHRSTGDHTLPCSEAATRHAIPSALPFLRRLKIRSGGGPRTFPGGVTKWQWYRMLEKKRRAREKAALRRERDEYECQRREFLRLLRGPERPWEDWRSDRAHITAAFDSDIQSVRLQTRSRRPWPTGYSVGVPASGLSSWASQSSGRQGTAEIARRRRCPWEAPADVASSGAAPLQGRDRSTVSLQQESGEGSRSMQQGPGRRTSRQQRGRFEGDVEFDGRVAEGTLPPVPWLTGKGSSRSSYDVSSSEFNDASDFEDGDDPELVVGALPPIPWLLGEASAGSSDELNGLSDFRNDHMPKERGAARAVRELWLEDDSGGLLYEQGASVEDDESVLDVKRIDGGESERSAGRGWDRSLEALLSRARQQSEDPAVGAGCGLKKEVTASDGMMPEHAEGVEGEHEGRGALAAAALGEDVQGRPQRGVRREHSREKRSVDRWEGSARKRSVKREPGSKRAKRQPQVLPPVPEHLLRRLEKTRHSLDLWNEND